MKLSSAQAYIIASQAFTFLTLVVMFQIPTAVLTAILLLQLTVVGCLAG
jgi:hypothetical protein